MSLRTNMKIPLCDPYLWEDPRYMFRSFWSGRQHDRSRGVCASELTNRVVAVYLVAILFGLMLYHWAGVKVGPIIVGLFATVYLIPSFITLSKVEGFRIKFLGSDTISSDSEDPSKLLAQLKNGKDVVNEGFTERATKGGFNQTGVVGAPANPFNNVLLNEIQYAPTRREAPDITSTSAKIAMDDFFRVQWYSDPTDVFGKAQSQREFVSQPSTTIPNDQGSYQNWLYKIPGKTCKEGNMAACYGGSEGATVPWLNIQN